MKNYSEEFKQLINLHKDKGFEYGKPIEYLEFRNSCSIEKLEKELLNTSDLKFVERQIRIDGKRYKAYYVYSNKKGRAYVLIFREKIRIITIYPLGSSTTRRYKAKFKK